MLNDQLRPSFPGRSDEGSDRSATCRTRWRSAVFGTDARRDEAVVVIPRTTGSSPEDDPRRPPAPTTPGRRPDQAGAVREHDSLHTVAQPELLEDVADVRPYGRVGDEELRRDLAVRTAPSRQRQDRRARSGVSDLELARLLGTGKGGAR